MKTNLHVPTDPGERLAWYCYRLKIGGETLRGLARKAGITYHTLRGAFFQPSYPSEVILAEAIGLTVEQLFPERYDAAGNRIPKVRERKRSAGQPARHGKKARAA